MSAAQIVLGIDPGFGRCGWGVIRVQGNRLQALDFGVIETSKLDPFDQRLKQLHEALRKVITAYQPQAAAVEEIYFSKNVKTAINVGQARGVILLTCCQADLLIAEYKPVEVKMAVTGFGAATKPQVQHMIKVLLGLEAAPKSDDAADALAIAICHAHTSPYARLHNRVCEA